MPLLMIRISGSIYSGVSFHIIVKLDDNNNYMIKYDYNCMDRKYICSQFKIPFLLSGKIKK